VLPGFVVKNNAVQYRSLRWEKSDEIVIKKLELTPLSERICGLKLVQIQPQSTHQKRGLCWITSWQFYWSRSYVYGFLWKFRASMRRTHEDTRGAPLACYPYINIKLTAYHLLLYLVYLCQKSQNFVHALICYKQKCKVVSLNLAHPVYFIADMVVQPCPRWSIE